ncbi:MAG: putative rane protein [Bacteroidota bacterium]|jgi:uncharacterized membrane protein
MSDSTKKSIFKTLSWHTMHVIMVGLIAYIVTKRLDLAALLASLEFVWESIMYFVHERLWAKFGKKVK